MFTQRLHFILVACLLFLTACGTHQSLLRPHHRSATEWHVCPSGDHAAAGTLAAPLRTIGEAAQRAMPGDTVVVHAGTYREQVNLPRGGTGEEARITYRAAESEKVVVKGSERLHDWRWVRGHVWQASVSNKVFNDFNPFALKIEGGWLLTGKWHHRGEVYLNGLSLSERQTRDSVAIDPMTWIASVGHSHTTITANFGGANPNKEQVEINVREAFFKPEQVGLNYITISGFHFAHAAANWAAPVLVEGTPEEKTAYRQEGGISTRMGKRWIIEKNHITDVKGVGIISGKDAHPIGEAPYAELSQYGDHEILNNHIARCGQSAIAGFYGLSRSTIRGNLIEDINHKQQYGGWETAAIKFHGAVDVVLENNLIRRVFEADAGGAYGIWMDMSNQSIRATRNIIYDTDQHAIYLEMNPGPILLDNNIIFGTVRIRGTQGLVSAHNLYVDTSYSARIEAERECALYAPHTRDKIGTATGIVRDNKFFNDIYIRSDMSGDFSELPGTEANFNLYLESSQPINPHALHSRSLPAFQTELKRTDTADGVFIEYQLPEAAGFIEAPWVDPELFGTFSITRDTIEDRFGHAIRVTRDFNGKKRKYPAVGPLAFPTSDHRIQWARKKSEL